MFTNPCSRLTADRTAATPYPHLAPVSSVIIASSTQTAKAATKSTYMAQAAPPDFWTWAKGSGRAVPARQSHPGTGLHKGEQAIRSRNPAFGRKRIPCRSSPRKE